MGKMPLLYQKLLSDLREYADIERHPLNKDYVAKRNALAKKIATTFRISKKDIPTLFKELEQMGKLKKQNQRKIRLR